MTAFGYRSESTSPARQRIEAAGNARAKRTELAARHASVAEAARQAAEAAEQLLQEKQRTDATRRIREAGMEQLATESERLLHEWRSPMPVILREVAERHKLKPRDILGESRSSPLCKARQECFWLSRERLGVSFQRIARFYHRDHSTVMHGYKAHRRRVSGALST